MNGIGGGNGTGFESIPLFGDTHRKKTKRKKGSAFHDSDASNMIKNLIESKMRKSGKLERENSVSE